MQIRRLCICVAGVMLISSLARLVPAAEPSTLTTPDGRIQIQAPDGYSERTPPRKEINIELVNEAEATTLLIISENQKHFDSLQAYGELVREMMTKKLKDPQADAGEKLQLNGNPALRYEITGISHELRMAFQVTIIQTETRFTQVVGSSIRSQFADHKREFEKVAKTVKELPAKKTEGHALAEPAPPVQRPNVLFILADDIGYGDLSCYGQKLDVDAAPDSFNALDAVLGRPHEKPIRKSLVMHNGGTQGPFAIRDGNWKLLEWNGGAGKADARQKELFSGIKDLAPGPLLFNLSTDLSESQNLAAANPQKVAELQALLKGSSRPRLIAASVRGSRSAGRLTVHGSID